MRTKARITVLKRMVNQRVRDQYLDQSVNERMAGRPCSQFSEGQEFIVGSQAPADFCHWAWADIHKDIVMVQCGGNPGYVGPDNTMISCCCDGFNPVVFKIERHDDSVDG